MFPVKKEPNSPPWGRSWEQDKSSRAAWSVVFRENSKWWTKIHTRLTWVSWVKKVIQQFYWLITFFGFNWGQSYLATLVTRQTCTKILRNLTFVAQFSYFIIRPKKFFVFFEQLLSNFRHEKQLLIFFLEQLFEKFRETFWKISSNLWKDLPTVTYKHLLLWTDSRGHNLETRFGDVWSTSPNLAV